LYFLLSYNLGEKNKWREGKMAETILKKYFRLEKELKTEGGEYTFNMEKALERNMLQGLVNDGFLDGDV
jgi:predicted kinase